jgi:hypothetical protein
VSDVEELWIGLHDTAMQMDFQWTDHTPVIFTYWHPFEPNNFQNTPEDCVTIWGPVSDPLAFDPYSLDPSPSHSCVFSLPASLLYGTLLFILCSCVLSLSLCVRLCVCVCVCTGRPLE